MEEVEWTEELCLKLIREFKERPVLWDSRDLLFFKKNIKPDIWAELGKAMDIDPEICKHKISVLMSSFRREKAKFLKNISFNHHYKSSWFAFQPMSFLLDRRTRSNAKALSTRPQSTKEDGNCLKNEDEEDEQSITISEPDDNDIFQWAAAPAKTIKMNSMAVLEPDANDTLQWAATPAKKAKIFVRDDLSKSVLPKSDERLPESPPKDCAAPLLNDEINYFSKFIASKMMKYSTATKNAVQQEIWKVIIKADDNFYEKQKPRKYDRPKERTKSPGNICEQQPSSSGGSMKLYYYSDSD